MMREFELDETDAFDGKKMSISLDSNLSRMYIGTNSGRILNYDILNTVPTLEDDYDLKNNGSQVPFVLNASIHDSLVCGDFNGYVY